MQRIISAWLRLGIQVTALVPGYERNRYQWRRRILANIIRAAKKAGVKYDDNHTFEVVVLLYLKKGKRYDIHDVDNRLKDILDALQGRFGGVQSKHRLIENDRQVCRVIIEKQTIPKSLSDNAGGRLLVRPYERRRWPLQRSKGDQFRKLRRKYAVA